MPRATDLKGRRSTSIRIPPELYDQIQAAAEERDVSVNWLVNAALREFIPRLIPANELTLTRQDTTP